jgi:uncharacterized protein (TIGR03083 family)
VQLTPRYGGEPVIRMVSLIDEPARPLLRQRARLATLLTGLDDEQWAVPSRCAGWSVQDVVAHLTTTNQFWALSVASAVDGTPTRFLAEFDPVATPAQLVDAARSWTASETLDRFVASNDALAGTVDGLADESWSVAAEAPPGHVAIGVLALHALWDAWIHERDIALPLGLTPVEEPDEIAASLAYVAGLGPAFLALSGSTRAATLEVVTTDPQLHLVVELGPSVVLRNGPPAPAAETVTLTGDAVELLEALSFRRPLTAELAPDDRWVLGSLGQIFDQSA